MSLDPRLIELARMYQSEGCDDSCDKYNRYCRYICTCGGDDRQLEIANDAIELILKIETEEKERAELARLKEKYEDS